MIDFNVLLTGFLAAKQLRFGTEEASISLEQYNKADFLAGLALGFATDGMLRLTADTAFHNCILQLTATPSITVDELFALITPEVLDASISAMCELYSLTNIYIDKPILCIVQSTSDVSIFVFDDCSITKTVAIAIAYTLSATWLLSWTNVQLSKVWLLHLWLFRTLPLYNVLTADIRKCYIVHGMCVDTVQLVVQALFDAKCCFIVHAQSAAISNLHLEVVVAPARCYIQRIRDNVLQQLHTQLACSIAWSQLVNGALRALPVVNVSYFAYAQCSFIHHLLLHYIWTLTVTHDVSSTRAYILRAYNHFAQIISVAYMCSAAFSRIKRAIIVAVALITAAQQIEISTAYILRAGSQATPLLTISTAAVLISRPLLTARLLADTAVTITEAISGSLAVTSACELISSQTIQCAHNVCIEKEQATPVDTWVVQNGADINILRAAGLTQSAGNLDIS